MKNVPLYCVRVHWRLKIEDSVQSASINILVSFDQTFFLKLPQPSSNPIMKANDLAFRGHSSSLSTPKPYTYLNRNSTFN